MPTSVISYPSQLNITVLILEIIRVELDLFSLVEKGKREEVVGTCTDLVWIEKGRGRAPSDLASWPSGSRNGL